jgi:gamma-glutamyltranspeptidase/glutathione hydrolase
MRDGKPFLAFAKQGGDEQDQLLLQFFLNIVEFGMTVQEACESAGFVSHQMYSSFGDHLRQPGSLVLNSKIPEWTRMDLMRKGYNLQFKDRTSGPVNAILFDQINHTLWGGSSNHGEDYGIGW